MRHVSHANLSRVRRATSVLGSTRRPLTNDHLNRGRVAPPVLEHHAPIRPPEQVAEHERRHYRIVQGPGDRDALRDEIDR